MIFLINYLIRIFCYCMTTVGIWMILKPIIQPTVAYSGRKIRLRVINSGKALQRRKQIISIFRHLDKYLYLKKDYDESSVVRFIIQTIAVFLISLFVSFMTIGDMPNQINFSNPFQDGVILSNDGQFFWQIPLVISFVISSIPYLYLRYQYARKHIQASYDLLEVAKLMLRHSNNNYAAYESLKLTADLLSKDNVLRKPLYILSNAFMSYASENDLQINLKRFESAIDTTFSTMFVHALLFGMHEGRKQLSKSLQAIVVNMENQMSMVLETYRKARDPIVLGRYGGIITLILVVPTAAFSLGWDVFFALLFKTKTGLILFTVIMLCLFISFLVSVALSKPRLDYF